MFDRDYDADVIFDDYGSSSDDVVDFGPGLAPADLTVERIGDDFVISVTDTGGTLTIDEQFDTYGRIEEFRFDDGTTWTHGDVAAFTAHGTSGNDTLTGSEAGETLDGAHGNDLISGGGGNDVLTGGIGDDTRDGGAGDDILTGGDGLDTFVFAPGSGTDAVQDFLAGAGGDVLDFRALGFVDFDAVLNATSAVDGDAVIDLGGGEAVALFGVDPIDLVEANVLLA